MKKTISILGSTGSIGKTTLNIIEKKNKNFSIYLLSANKNVNLILVEVEIIQPRNFF